MTDVLNSPQQKIAVTLEQLRRCTQIDVLSNWTIADGALSITEIQDNPNVESVSLNARRHISWQRGRQAIWLVQHIEVPIDLHHYRLSGLSLRLSVSWWAEIAEIYINGKLIQSGDLFDCSTRILLSPKVIVGNGFLVAIRLVSPNHDEGALVRSLCLYENDQNPLINPGFFANEIEVIYIQCQQNQSLVETLAKTVDQIDWSSLPNREQFERSLNNVRNQLIDFGDYFPTINIGLLGHAHLDLAWLWPVAETIDAAKRTFESVLNLQQEFQDLIFTHSTPALFAWIEVHRPDLFEKIVEKVRAGTWEIAAGLWVEPELNIISAESIVRQILYGQLYVKEKFGNISEVAWLPDSFGFCWQLPQLLRQGGIRYFVTQKLRWNDTTEFPYEVFWWQGLDGTRIFSFMSAFIGQEIDPIKMANYAIDWQNKTKLNSALWLPGVGDHGGGPTRDMLEVSQRWQQSTFFPDLEFIPAKDYLRQLEVEAESLPVWQDELYLEFHRGCYTTHADQKRWNRYCERLLYQAELWAAIATLRTEAVYPKMALETAWKQVLFNQFHDILPGSAIAEAYLDANQAWQEAQESAEAILDSALSAIATHLPLPSPPAGLTEAMPIWVFNALNWSCSEVVSLPISQPGQIYDIEGDAIETQNCSNRLLFKACGVPSIGYKLYWWMPERGYRAEYTPHFIKSVSDLVEDVNIIRKHGENYYLENQFLQVFVDAETGDIQRIFDKVNYREVLQSGGGNQLQFFQDTGQYWDAWNIDPNYKNFPLQTATLKDIHWITQGKVEKRLRIIRVWGKSEFCQDYVLQQDSNILKIETTVNWQDTHVLVKVAFPITINADFATTEIPAGVMSRTTKPQTDVEKAKWEIPALNWVDLGDEEYGISLLNNCKYGYDIKPSQIRLTLLRGSTWPDPKADIGQHHFSYGIYPHAGSWKTANVVQRGYEFNQPLSVNSLPAINHSQINHKSVGEGSFFDLQSDHLILMALKQSEQDPKAWIFRCYECHGEAETLVLQNQLNLTIVDSVNLLEQPIESSIQIQPWQIASFKMKLNQEINNPSPLDK
ncbi:MAG: alpha-mannosidase [Microcoleaceae cyanobacterium]